MAVASPAAGAPAQAPSAGRVLGLDGFRGLAALFVVLNHVFLRAWPGLVLGRVPPGTPTFLVLAAVLVPLTVGFARLFAAVFEFPFQRHRGWRPLRRAVGDRLRRYPGDRPAKSS